ncbi:type I-G CRISPR-associated helicase/endonuclease Cas3g [Candidatus Palauibacter sp.]|uniref:type I-G CRISPR-associated helicase/endonuclease Cas3g n=1 Tax=Candidatus Palauibacter sp. TaxID=3101350 RepID=UPI003B59C499
MAEVAGSDFRPFFRDVHGYEPFPWQERLADQVLAQGWPTVIDLPTGTGKTAALDIAVFALAAQPETAPRRIVFVIDRRIVVDQVCVRAHRVRDRIRAGSTDVLRRVDERLQALSGGKPLGVMALRGGIPISREWTLRPDQPWVLVSTVDQFGSRLLFRGYGVTPKMLPIHAGLAGNDCLVILDEVHLSVPFAETLEQASRLPFGPIPRRFQTVRMSATPDELGGEPFRLDPIEDVEGCPELQRRVRAEKSARLKQVGNRKAVPTTVLKLIRDITKSREGVTASTLGVVVNRVGTARSTYEVLAGAGFKTHLLTGRMRPLDRVQAVSAIEPAVDPSRSETDDELTVVVATQAIEVGADFSFDALITECAPVDSLRQRFGRLDRRGTLSERRGASAPAWILGIKPELTGKRTDPIYGDAVKETWAELQRRMNGGSIDVGADSLADFPAEALAPRLTAPLLLKTHMDAWVQTNPQPIIQPPVDWFLHGIDERNRAPDVSIVWRHDRTPDALRLVPPRQAESLPIPIHAAKSWLGGREEIDFADVVAIADVGADDDYRVPDCIRWRGIGEGPEWVNSAQDIRPGDILVVDPDRGGLRAGTWDPSSTETVADLGDEAQLAHQRRVTLRLDMRLSSTASFSHDPPAPEDELDGQVRSIHERVQEWLEEQAAGEARLPAWLYEVLDILGARRETERRTSTAFEHHLVQPSEGDARGGYYVLTQRDPVAGRPTIDPSVMDGSDDAGSMTGSAVTLRQHLDGVAARARGFAERLGVGATLVNDLHLAGRLHDLGKVDPRFQEQLVGGDRVQLAMLDEPLGKSPPDVRRVQRYPAGMRHEIASVAMIQSSGDILASAHDPELVLHLVATHHGWARPLPPILEDPDPQTLTHTVEGHSLEANSDLARSSMAPDMADRFWRLVERYGYHGLAWLETVLRLADQRQSANEERT